MPISIRYGKNVKIAKCLYQLGMEKNVTIAKCLSQLGIEKCKRSISIRYGKNAKT